MTRTARPGPAARVRALLAAPPPRLLALGAAALAAVAGVGAATSGRTGATVQSVDGATLGYRGVPVADGVRLAGRVPLTVTDLAVWERLVTALPTVATLVTAAVALWLCGPLFADLRAGRPFADATPQRLGRVAAVVMVGWAAWVLADWAAAAVVVSHVPATPAGVAVDAAPHLDLTAPLFAWLLLFVREAAWHGRRMADDVEGLV